MRRRLDHENCAVARALDILSDPWGFLILREAFLGARRFRDFEEGLDISKNVLSARLARLVDAGIFETEDRGRYGKRYEYRLTAKGKDLAVVMTALRQWGDRWVFGPGNEPLQVLDRRTGRPIARLRLLDDEGRPLRGADIEVRPGPGASPTTVARYRARRKDHDDD